MIEVFHRMFRSCMEIDIPIVAVVNGVSLGGGCEVISFCDMVLASDESRIGQPEIAVGVFPPVAAAWFPKIIGLKKTYELLLTGKMIGARRRRRSAWSTRSFPRELQGRVDKFLAELLNKSRPILIWTKRAIRASLDLRLRRQASRPPRSLYLDGCMTTEDAKEGIAAFMEKRKAVWKDE